MWANLIRIAIRLGRRFGCHLFVVWVLAGFAGHAVSDAADAPPETPAAGDRSAGWAVAASASATLVPAAIGIHMGILRPDSNAGLLPLAAGLIVGPSAGSFYARHANDAISGVAARAAIAAVTAVVAGVADWVGGYQGWQVQLRPSDRPDDRGRQAARAVAILGGMIILIQGIDEIAGLPAEVGAYERREANPMTITPVLPGPSTAPGIAVRVALP